MPHAGQMNGSRAEVTRAPCSRFGIIESWLAIAAEMSSSTTSRPESAFMKVSSARTPSEVMLRTPSSLSTTRLAL